MTQQSIPLAERTGRKTIIFDHCERRSEEEGYEECIFLCLKQGRKYYAMDLPIKPDIPTLGLEQLRKESGGWWKRYSLYSALAVQEIKVRLMKVDRPASRLPQFRVALLSIDYDRQLSEIDTSIDLAVDLDADGVDLGECGIDVNGKSHDDSFDCPNAGYDELDGPYCKVKRVRNLSRQRVNCEWLPSMLECYWQDGVDGKGLAFLRNAGFVHSYKGLQYDTYSDAADPYGSAILAFLLVEGWHIRYLLILVGLGLSGSICIIAIVAALSGSLEVALTAGSYACGLAGCLIAVFTFLSAVL